MGRLFPTNGMKFFIGAAKEYADTDFVASDFTTGSPSWVEIKGTTDMGGFGDEATLISSEHVGSGRTRKAKGSRNAGQMALVCDLDYADPGQLAAIAAEKNRGGHAFKVVLNDAPAGGKASERYFTALVMSARENFGGANSPMQLNITLEIDSNIVRVAAEEA
jgi:hypothetical protein